MFVYGLYSNDSPAIRYIGKTNFDVGVRLRQHQLHAARGCKGHVYNWIRSCAEVHAVVVGVVDTNEEACRMEQFLIRSLPNLTNQTLGGEGRLGYVMPEKVKQRIAASNRGLKRSEEQCDNMSYAAIGKRFTCSEQGRQNMKASWTKERREEFGESRRGVPMPQSQRDAIKASWIKRRQQKEVNQNVEG